MATPPPLGDYPQLEATLYALRSATTRMTAVAAARRLWYIRSVEHAEAGTTVTKVGMWTRRSGGTKTVTTFAQDKFTRRHPVEAGECRHWVDRIEARGTVEPLILPERLAVIGTTVPSQAQCSANYYELGELNRAAKDAQVTAKQWLTEQAAELQARLLHDGAVVGGWVRFEGDWAFQLGREQFSRDIAWERFPLLAKPYTGTQITTLQDTWRFVPPRDEDAEYAAAL